MREHSMRKSNQILHSDHHVLHPGKNLLVALMLTRDLFAVANLVCSGSAHFRNFWNVHDSRVRYPYSGFTREIMFTIEIEHIRYI